MEESGNQPNGQWRDPCEGLEEFHEDGSARGALCFFPTVDARVDRELLRSKVYEPSRETDRGGLRIGLEVQIVLDHGLEGCGETVTTDILHA
jgi:hypothetical protein